MTNLELQLFQKTNDVGTVERYSLRITLTFDEFGYNLNLASGPFQGTVDSTGTKFVIDLTAEQNLESGEVGAWCYHPRTNLREIDGILPLGNVEAVEVNITSTAKGTQSGSIVLADADEEEARPVNILTLPAKNN